MSSKRGADYFMKSVTYFSILDNKGKEVTHAVTLFNGNLATEDLTTFTLRIYLGKFSILYPKDTFTLVTCIGDTLFASQVTNDYLSEITIIILPDEESNEKCF